MKKIINGYRYDTEKAILVGESGSSGYAKSDFNYWEAGLYKTKRSGKFFVAGQGHAMTRFASHCAGLSGWGSKIIPMAPEEALEWAEQNLNSEIIEEHFADQIQDA